MKKILFSLCTASFLVFTAATPSFAAENIFQRIGHSISNEFQRLYLMLPGDKSGDAVMNQALQVQDNLKSFTLDDAVTIDFLRDNTSLSSVKFDFYGPFENPEKQPSGQFLRQSFTLSAEARTEGTSLRFASDVKLTDKNFYFKINEFPAVLPFLNPEDIQGKWLRVDLTKQASGSAQMTPEEQKDVQNKMHDATTQLLQKIHFGTAKKENKDGRNVFVVDGTIPASALKDFVHAVINDLPTRVQSTDPTRRKKALEAVDKILDKVGDIKMTEWVDQSTYYTVHSETQFSYPIEKNASPNAENSNNAQMMASMGPLAALRDVNKINFSMVANMSKFDEPVQFDEPSDAQDAQTVFSNVFGNTMGKMQSPATSSGLTPPPMPAVTPTELQQLTPKQRQLLQKYQNMNMQKAGQLPQSLPPTNY